MLVLTRKQGETVVIGGDGNPQQLVKVTLLDIENGKVKLGVEAPVEIPVHRWEVWEAIQRRGPPVSPLEPSPQPADL